MLTLLSGRGYFRVDRYFGNDTTPMTTTDHDLLSNFLTQYKNGYKKPMK